MKKTLVLLFVLSVSFVFNSYSQKKLDQVLSQITPELLMQYVNYLASDSMKGRNTPSPELNRAAEYIANEFALMEIEKVNGSYFQNIPFCTKNLDVERCLLKISNGQESKIFNIKSDYTPFEMTADTTVKSTIVFAGYGITAPEFNYDDYKSIDVNGKIVLIMKHEPGERDSKSPFDGSNDTKYSALKVKLENAKKHGAAGLLVITDPLNHILYAPQGYPWPSLSKYLPQDNLPVELCIKENSIPFVQVSDSVILYLLGSVDSLKNIQRRIDTNYTPQSFYIKGTDCTLSTKLKIDDLVARNVVGYIKGKNAKLKNELVIIGGHYDHIGFITRHKADEDYIYNGADDNASGTAGVLAAAKAFASMKVKPKRSILFILFAGEEKGLYGSEYYCLNPLFPISNTVAMLNLDMISRNGNDTLEIEGEKLNPDLAKIVRKENEIVGLKIIEPKEDLFSRSDQYNFFIKNISVIGFTSGLHKDYHTVRDKLESINPFKASQISKLAFRTAWYVSNDRKRYAVIKKAK